MNNSYRKLFWLLAAICCVALLPWLGLADFHTKGEPREAVVAFSMLDSGDWILPRNNGGEIPYKPPFFHWCIAAVSLLFGQVNEFTSRLPSALSLIAMTLVGFAFYARRKGAAVSILMALITLSAFELHRAGANCRVDMMLTAFTVIALYLLYRWYEHGLRGVPWLAILMMSCGTLTKGPVGSVIPCLVFGVFLLLRGVNFFRAFFLLAAWGVLSFVLPLCWYVAAWHQGGQEFLDLVMEENFGRMTSTMSYESCVNPWPYNFVTLAGGYLPWILLALMSLFSWRKIRKGHTEKSGNDSASGVPAGNQPGSLSSKIAGAWHRFLGMEPVDLFSLLAIVVIFLFYCFPQSKRSVYLMPIYPFIAYFLARYVIYLVKVGSKAVKAYGTLLAVLGFLLTAAFVAVKCGVVPQELVGAGRQAAQNLAMLDGISRIGGWAWVLVCLPVVLSVAWFAMIARKGYTAMWQVWGVCILTFGLYLALDGAYQPAVLNAKSQREIAAQIDTIAPARQGGLYEFVAAGEFAAGDPVHLFEINFYLDNRIGNFRREKPSEGFLLIPADDAGVYIPQWRDAGYEFETLYVSDKDVIFHQPVKLYHFNRNKLTTI